MSEQAKKIGESAGATLARFGFKPKPAEEPSAEAEAPAATHTRFGDDVASAVTKTSAGAEHTRFTESPTPPDDDEGPLAAALEESSLIPPSVSAMVSAGERSGRLPEVLVTIADCSEEDLEATVKRTTSLIEPALIVVLGLLVGLIALAMLLPVFGMSRVVAG